MSLSFGLNVRTVLSLRVYIVIFSGLHLLVWAALGAPRAHRAARNRAYEGHTACMPVAHDANAAYSGSRSDAKAAR